MLVVLPTPPFWLATVMTRVRSGRGRSPSRPPIGPGRPSRPRGRSGVSELSSPRSGAVSRETATSLPGCMETRLRRGGAVPSSDDRRHRDASRAQPDPDHGRGRLDHARLRPAAPRPPRPASAPTWHGAASSSSRAVAPLMAKQLATTAPAAAASSRASRSSGATARAVTTSNRRALAAVRPDHARLRRCRAPGRRPPRGGSRRGAAGARRARRSDPVGGWPGRYPAAGSAADVAHQRPGATQRSEHRAVEQVPIPQPRDLARSEQAALDARPRQPVGVALRQREAVTEDGPGR